MVDSSMIPKLRKQIKSPDITEREQAVNILSKFSHTTVAGVAANIIIEALEDNNLSVRQTASDALITLGDAGIKALVGMLYCHDWDANYLEWQTATKILIKFGVGAI